MSKELHGNKKYLEAIAPVAANRTNGTVTGATIDRAGYNAAVEFVAQSGAVTDGSHAVQVFAGDASDMSDEAQVTSADDLVGTAPTFVAADDNVTKKIGYRGNKRYSRIKLVTTGATTGGIINAIAVLGEAQHIPSGGLT